MAQVRAEDLPRVSPTVAFPGVCAAMAGGFVLGSVTLVWGGPGVGKSRLMLQLADAVDSVKWSTTGIYHSALYVATEQPPEHVKHMAELVGVGESSFLVSHQRYPEGLHHLVREERPSFVIVDSIQGMLDEPGQLVHVTKRLVQTAREFACAMVLVFHETKAGDYAGPRTVEHDVDCMVSLESSVVEGIVWWRIAGKYRFGPSHVHAILHEEGGRFYDRGAYSGGGDGRDGATDPGGTLDRHTDGSAT